MSQSSSACGTADNIRCARSRSTIVGSLLAGLGSRSEVVIGVVGENRTRKDTSIARVTAHGGHALAPSRLRAGHAPEPPEVFRATSAMLPIQPGSIASARAPDRGSARRCLRVCAAWVRVPRARRSWSRAHTERRGEWVGLSAAEPRQYCQAVSAILHWSAKDNPTPSPTRRTILQTLL